MGAGDNKVDAVAYKAQVKTEHYKLDVSLSVTEQGCIPLGETVVGVARGGQYTYTTGYAVFLLMDNNHNAVCEEVFIFPQFNLY